MGCGVDLMAGEGDGPPIAPIGGESLGDDEGDSASDVLAQLKARGIAFRRRHRLHGQFLLYGGRIDAGKGCEELLEYFTSYKEQGGDATLVLMGVKLMQIPEVPWVRFAGLLSERERLQALEAATIVVVPSPFESLSLLALEAMAVGTPDPLQRPQRGVRRTLREEQCRAVLHGPRRVHRVCVAAARRRAAAPVDGPQRQGVRQAELPLGRDLAKYDRLIGSLRGR